MTLNYLPGRLTIHPSIKKMVSGEYLVLCKDDNSITKQSYIDVSRDNMGEKLSKQQLLNDISNTLDESIERLISIADGRPIILALSGGVDSRLIALHLKKAGYENVLAYTNNLHSSSDIKLGKQIANQLDFDWVRMDHTVEEAEQLYNGSYYRELQHMIGNYGTVFPYIERKLAMNELTKNTNLPDNGVIVKGYAIYAMGGGLDGKILNYDEITVKENVDLILDSPTHYIREQLSESTKDGIRNRLEERIRSYMNINNPICSNEINGLEKWYLYERLPGAFLRSSGYEYKNDGFDFWFPLCDQSILSIYLRLPIKERIGKSIFEEHGRKLGNELFNDPSKVEIPSSESSRFQGAKYLIKRSPLHEMAKKFRDRYFKDREYEKRPKYAFMSEDEYEKRRLWTRDVSYRSFLAADNLARSEVEIEDDLELVPPIQKYRDT